MIKLPTGIDLNNLLKDLRKFSWEASEILLYYSKILKDSKNKSNILKNYKNDDPVTLADLEVNELIIKRINEKYKNIDWEILSEENVKNLSDSFYPKKDWVWVLDPLDGTKDFIQGTKDYAMHLALNYKKKPFLGVVLIPERNELWIADGTKLLREKKEKSLMQIKLFKKTTLQDMVVVTSKNHRNQTLKKLIDKVGFKQVNIMGSIGCKISSILRNEADIYISLSLPGQSAPKDWDFSAPEVILKAAGGAITNLYNEDLIYGNSNFEQGGVIIASNNKTLHKNYCSQIREIIKKNKLFPLES